jgi:mannose-6-phosphate isomerase-like protein (cupin superfamily)
MTSGKLMAREPRAFDRCHTPFELIPGEDVRIRLYSVAPGSVFAVLEAQILPMGGQPSHRHLRRDKIFEVLEGEVHFTCAGEGVDLLPGSTIIVARGVEHSWINRRSRIARMLFSFFPSGGNEPFPESVRHEPRAESREVAQ